MTPESFTQIVVNGLVLSLMYILVAIGLSVIFSMLRMVTFAHGEMYMLGAYLGWLFVSRLGVPYVASVLLATAAMFFVGMALERALWRPLLQDPLRCLIMTLALSLVLQGGVAAVFGATDKGIQSPFAGAFSVLGVHLSTQRVAMVVGAVVMLVATLLFFRRHKLGIAMRVVAQDPQAAALQGIPVEQIQRLGFGLGCALAAFAGGLMGAIFAVNPLMGQTPIIKAFVVVVLGGLGSIPGSILAGLIIGMIDSFSVTFLGSIGNIFAFLIFIFVLLLRPRGLMGYEV